MLLHKCRVKDGSWAVWLKNVSPSFWKMSFLKWEMIFWKVIIQSLENRKALCRFAEDCCFTQHEWKMPWCPWVPPSRNQRSIGCEQGWGDAGEEGSCQGNNPFSFVLPSATTVKRKPCTTAAGTLPTAPSSVSRSTGMPNTNVPAAGKDERVVPPLEHHPNDCYSQTERFLFPKKKKEKKSQNCLEFASHFAPAFKHFS